MLDSAPLNAPGHSKDGIYANLPTLPRWVLLLAAATLYVSFFDGLSALGLVGPDEPRYAEVAREMLVAHDWVTPRLYGRPWFEKPILYYWSASAAYGAFGVNEFSARLPSALAALFTTLLLAWTARRHYGTSTLTSLFLTLPTCAAMIGFARVAGPEMLFAAALTGALVAAHEILRQPSGRRRTLLAHTAFGVFVGLAALAKGPAALALAGGSATLWAAATARWRQAIRMAHPVALAAFSITALPWYLLCARRNPDFLTVFIIQHNFVRYLTPFFHHEQPFWFYVPTLVVALLPWTAVLAWLASDLRFLWRDRESRMSPRAYIVCWILFVLLFFSLSKSKLPGYILPAIPALFLLMAESLGRIVDKNSVSARLLFLAVGFTFAAVGLVNFWTHKLGAFERIAVPGVFAFSLVSLGGAFVVGYLGVFRRPAAALLATALVSVLLIETLNWQWSPALDLWLSPRAAARAAQQQPGAAETVFAYRLDRAWHYGLNFYLRRELPEWAESPRPAWVFTNGTGISALKGSKIRFTVVADFSPQAVLVRVEPSVSVEQPYRRSPPEGGIRSRKKLAMRLS